MGAIPILPSPVPLGTIAEYEETELGGWEQVSTPTSQNVLEIPSQLYIPTGELDVYLVYSAACGTPGGIAQNCGCLAHDATIGGVFEVGSENPPTGEDCLTALLSDPDIDCVGNALQFDGASVTAWYPDWFLNELVEAGIYTAIEIETLTIQIDYITYWCNPIELTIPFSQNPFIAVTLPPPPPPPQRCLCGVRVT